MDLVLLTLAISSLAAAGVLGWLVRQMMKREQARSAARVAELAREIAADGGDQAPRSAPVAVAASGSGILFRPPAAGASFPVFRAGLAAAIIVFVIVLVAMTSGGSNGAAETPGPYAPPELLSVHHAREGDTLTVSGLVRNPVNGATLSHVSAVVLVFDRSGEFVATGRAALDYTTFSPGDESPFRIVIPNVADVGRYRVAFRNDEGRLEHVDRRGLTASPARAGGFVRSEPARRTSTSPTS
jgi:hypothetical protein